MPGTWPALAVRARERLLIRVDLTIRTRICPVGDRRYRRGIKLLRQSVVSEESFLVSQDENSRNNN